MRAAAPVHPWLSAVAVMFGTMMVFLDTTVVNLSLPYIAGSLSASIPEATWALTSYLAANAVVLPLSGWLANYLGRKRLLLLSLGSFTFASLLCGLAPSMEMLIALRIVQGLTGGVMQPLSQAIMLEGFEPHERGRAMGFWSLGIILAPILGPLLGGWLTQTASWRWVFFINVPFGIAGMVMVSWFVFDPPYIRRSTEVIDYVGIGLLALGIGGLQILLDRGQAEDWFASPWMVFLLVVGIVALVLFVVHSLHREHPVADLRVFRDRTFAVGSILSGLVGFLLFGSIVLLPLLLQTALHYPPLEAGLVIAQRGVGALLAFPIVGLLTDHFDARKLLILGLLLGSGTMYWFSVLIPGFAASDLFWPQFVQGIALGLLFVPLTTLTMSHLQREHMGNASSLYNAGRNFGSSIGIAVTATVLERSRLRYRSVLGEHISELDPVTQSMRTELETSLAQTDASWRQLSELATGQLVQRVELEASLLAFMHTFRLFALIFLLMVPLALLMRQPDRS